MFGFINRQLSPVTGPDYAEAIDSLKIISKDCQDNYSGKTSFKYHILLENLHYESYLSHTLDATISRVKLHFGNLGRLPNTVRTLLLLGIQQTKNLERPPPFGHLLFVSVVSVKQVVGYKIVRRLKKGFYNRGIPVSLLYHHWKVAMNNNCLTKQIV